MDIMDIMGMHVRTSFRAAKLVLFTVSEWGYVDFTDIKDIIDIDALNAGPQSP